MPSPVCKKLIETLDDYILRDLPPEVLEQLDGHLGRCPPCREYLRDYRAIVGGLERVREGAVSIPEQRTLERLIELLVKRGYS